MKIRDSFDEGVQVLHVSGNFDVDEAERLYAHVDHAIDRDRLRVVLDAEGVGELTSGALVALVRARKKLRELGGGLAVAHLSPSAAEAFHAVGLEKSVTCFDTVADAVAHFDDVLAPSTTLLGEIAWRPDDLACAFSFIAEGQIEEVGDGTFDGRIVALNRRGVVLRPRRDSHAAHRPWLFTYDVPLRVSFELPLAATD